MKFASRENFLLGLVELLFALLLILSVVISTEEKPKKADNATKVPGRYLVVMRWPQSPNTLENDDIDLHVAHIESGEHSWYGSPSSAQSYITMDSVDDTSVYLRYYTDIDTGKFTLCQDHEERITINTTTPGEVAVVAFMYSKRWNNVPIKVTVTLIDLKNSQELAKEEVELLYTGQQKVAFRFTLDESGNIVPGSRNQRPYLIEAKK